MGPGEIQAISAQSTDIGGMAAVGPGRLGLHPFRGDIMKHWLKRFAPERKDGALRTLIALNVSQRPAWGPRSYAQFAQEGYARNPVVFRCVRLVAESAASIRLRADRDGRPLEPDDPAAHLLEHPSPEQSAPELLECFYGYLQVAGNAYLEAAEIDGVPKALFALRPDRMTVLPGDKGWPAGWEYKVEGRKTRFLRDPVSGRSPILHMKVFNPADDYYGLSPMEAAAFAVDTHAAGGAWNKALLDNAARPSGALVYSGPDRLTEDQFERLKGELAESHQGPRAAGRPLLLEGGLDWKPLSLTPADMDFVEAKHASAREIALAFGTPPLLLGLPGDNTYANYKEANLAFWRQTVLPLARKTARALTTWLRPWLGRDLTIACEEAEIPALAEERGALWSQLETASFLSTEEKRKLAGLGSGD
jgi:HK97 family phage portal protein